ncbi:MAG: methyltransferase domain-containing protein [Desulfobacterales bacterium]|nr:methyltransferase domain-containing protein [Desulfobacterales bacterium]MDD4391887.1 methyltransferase domain-containing protein [Desulfobacterales bacterium]
MDFESLAPYRHAMIDCYNGDTLAKLIIYRDDGYREDHCISTYFQEGETLSSLNKAAIDLCRGNVLDVGGGAGRHSLALQKKGYRVCSIDICPEAVAIMKKRGVADARCVDVFDFDETSFDTVLLMMHGIGVVKDLNGLQRFLVHARGLIHPEGQILMDSVDMRKTTNQVHLAYQEYNRRNGRYFGETQLIFEYRGKKGLPFKWLQVDHETLAEYARSAGWSCSIPYSFASGDYLACLQLN